ncbi:MAG TPA: hypothetical protein VGN13_12500 [Solirubrobacteraceae bacterium]|jgi:hypothetical protein
MDGEVLCRDVHPADILMPDGSMLTGLRVFVTSHRLIGFRAGPEIERVVDEPLANPGCVPACHDTLSSSERLEMQIEGGHAWVNRGTGCGCGSPLKALAPPVGWTG